MDNTAIDSRQALPPPRPLGWPDILGTWRLCRKRVCQRRKRCCGEACACLRTNLPLLPESVQAWFATLMKARSANVAFEEAMAALNGSWEEEGYIAWRKAIGQPVTAQEP